MAHEKVNPDAMKITNQFRSRTGFVYELKADGVRLTVSIAQRQGPTDEAEWCVEAKSNAAPDSAPILAWRDTRAEALREVGRAWSTSAANLGLPPFDWDAATVALTNVRAV